MRDDRHKWNPQVAHHDPFVISDVTLREVSLSRQIMVSGPRVRDDLAHAIGWPAIASGETYCLSLRRDRVLVVYGLQMLTGWDSTTEQAVSDVTDGFRVFDLSGARALAVLRRGAELSLHVPSASAARLVFGLNCILYRYATDDLFRIHVARGYGEALVLNLRKAMQAAADHTV